MCSCNHRLGDLSLAGIYTCLHLQWKLRRFLEVQLLTLPIRSNAWIDRVSWGYGCRSVKYSQKFSPGLLSLWAGPVQTAHVTDRVVGLGERSEYTEDWVGHHNQQWQHPGGGNDSVSVGSGLPRPRLQWVADGAVPFNCNSHEAEGWDADREPYRKE